MDLEPLTPEMSPIVAPADQPRRSPMLRLALGGVAAAALGLGGFLLGHATTHAATVQVGNAGATTAAAGPATGPGCTSGRRSLAGGTVSALKGGTFTLTGPAGRTTQVTTSAATTYFKTTKGSVADAKPGTSVVVRGRKDSSGNVSATEIVVGSSGRATGTVVSNDGKTIVVKRADGSTENVTPATSVSVIRTDPAKLGDVTDGATAIVSGARAADGSLAADVVTVYVGGVKPFAGGGPGLGRGGPGFGPGGPGFGPGGPGRGRRGGFGPGGPLPGGSSTPPFAAGGPVA